MTLACLVSQFFTELGPARPQLVFRHYHKNFVNLIKGKLNRWIVNSCIIYFNHQRRKVTPGFHRLVVKNVTGKNRPGQAMSRCTSSGSGSSQNLTMTRCTSVISGESGWASGWTGTLLGSRRGLDSWADQYWKQKSVMLYLYALHIAPCGFRYLAPCSLIWD